MFDLIFGDPRRTSTATSGDVRAWSEELLDLDRCVDDSERIAQLSALEDLKAAACAAQARIAVDFAASQERAQADTGIPSARCGAGIAAQVALARRESPHRGGRLLGLATALVHEMPHTLAALDRGLLNEWRATVIVRETACLSRQDRSAIDAEVWADPARVTTLGDRALAARVRSLAYRADPQASVARAGRAESERCVTLRPAPDTMTYLTALLPVAQGVAAYAALRRAADASRANGDDRSRGQVMADVLVERVTGLAHAAEVPVQVHLVLTDDTLLDGGHDAATVTGYGPIPATVARKLVAGASARQLASLRRLYIRPGDGRLVSLESRSRCFPSGLADFIDLRDQTCRTPWCDAPIRHHDHVISDGAGGPTEAGNGQGLCEACNYAKQAPGWRARPSPDGSITTTTPTGARYASPEPDPPGGRPRRTRVFGARADLVWDLPRLEYDAA